MKRWFNSLSKRQKSLYSFLLVGIVLTLLIGVPTLANLIKALSSSGSLVWDGTTASSYAGGTGTSSDPYIISNGEELAYFQSQLVSNNYQNTHFALGANILLNEGIFDYDSSNGIMYILNGTTYYVNPFTKNYYPNPSRTGSPSGTINIFPSMPNFKGTFDGNSYTIYGAYVTSSSAYEVGLFTNLQGTIKNVQIANSMVYGGTVTGGVAGSTNGADLVNILFDGYVVGTGISQNLSQAFNPANMVFIVTSAAVTQYIDILSILPFKGGQFVNSTISGHFNPDQGPANKMVVTVNGVTIPTSNQPGPFPAAGQPPIQTGANVMNVPVVGTLNGNSGQFTLSQMVFTVYWDYAATGGIVGHSNNTTMKYVINKADVTGKLTAGGLAGTATGTLDISSSYNTGTIKGVYSAGGLVGILDKSNNVAIKSSYNTGALAPANANSGGIIGRLFNNNPNAITLTNVFNTANNHTLGTIIASTVNVNGFNYIFNPPVGSGSVNGPATQVTNTDLQAKQVLIAMGFKEFISEEDLEINPENCWVYEGNEYPLLYNDNKLKSSANLYVGSYLFSRFSESLGVKAMKNNITFMLEPANIFQPLKEKYFYIVEGNTPLSKSDLELLGPLDWEPYTSIEQITTEGEYIIYAKIVDYSNNISYLNSDVLRLDLTNPSATLTLDGTSWNSLKSSSSTYINLERDDHFTVSASDAFSGVDKIEYYISDTILSASALDSLNYTLWHTYETDIKINSLGTFVINIKVTDKAGNYTYVNSDYLVNMFNDYSFDSMSFGYGNLYSGSNNINNRSSVKIEYSYSSQGNLNIVGFKHNLMTSMLFPKDTKITLIDHVTETVYYYLVPDNVDNYGYGASCPPLPPVEPWEDPIEDTCEKVATYPLTLFMKVGTDQVVNFVESTYASNGTIEEQFTIIIDFAKTNTNNNYEDVKVYLELVGSDDAVLRSTDPESIDTFNFYSTVDASNTKANFALSSNYGGSSLNLNSDSALTLNLTSKLNYKTIQSVKIFDTYFENYKQGLAIKLVNSSGNIMPREALKNISFKVGNTQYYPGSDNIIRLPLGLVINDSNVSLTITTYDNPPVLANGTYYIKISNYISDDGYYVKAFGSGEITIPVIVSKKTNQNYGFKVVLNGPPVVNKLDVINDFDIKISYSGDLVAPSVRVSLWEKEDLSALNQNYSIIDLQNHVTNSLTKHSTNYYLISGNIKLNLIANNYNKNGYRLVFDLYDGNEKVDTIKKYFVVK